MCVPVLSGLLYLSAVSLGAVVTQLRVYCRSARRSAHFWNAAVHRVQVAVNDAHPGVVRLVDSGSYVRRWLPLSLQLHAGAASPHSSDERTLHSSLALSTAVVLNPLPRARCALTEYTVPQYRCTEGTHSGGGQPCHSGCTCKGCDG